MRISILTALRQPSHHLARRPLATSVHALTHRRALSVLDNLGLWFCAPGFLRVYLYRLSENIAHDGINNKFLSYWR